jgi:hypothetical protein
MRSAHAVYVCAKLKAMPNLWHFTFPGRGGAEELILASFPSREIWDSQASEADNVVMGFGAL